LIIPNIKSIINMTSISLTNKAVLKIY